MFHYHKWSANKINFRSSEVSTILGSAGINLFLNGNKEIAISDQNGILMNP